MSQSSHSNSARPAPGKCVQLHPGAPECTLDSQMGKTNPPRPAAPHASDEHGSGCTRMHPGAPECTTNSRNGETNPPRQASQQQLSLAQHAAIRALVRGYPLGKIARHLGVSRHTITRWKRLPHFVAEV